MSGGRPVRVEIGRISVGATSGLEARRLADALPAAIGRALAGLAAGAAPAPAPAGPGRILPAADQAAAQVAAIVDARMRAGR